MSQASTILIWIEKAINFTDKFNLEPDSNLEGLQKRRKLNSGESVNVTPSCSYHQEEDLDDSVRNRMECPSTIEPDQNINLKKTVVSNSTQTPSFGETSIEDQSKIVEPPVMLEKISTSDSENTPNADLAPGSPVSPAKTSTSLSPRKSRPASKAKKDHEKEVKKKKPHQRKLSNVHFEDSVGASGLPSIGGMNLDEKDVNDIKDIMLQTCEAIAGKLINVKQKKRGLDREIQISVRLSLPPSKPPAPAKGNSCSQNQPTEESNLMKD